MAYGKEIKEEKINKNAGNDLRLCYRTTKEGNYIGKKF